MAMSDNVMTLLQHLLRSIISGAGAYTLYLVGHYLHRVWRSSQPIPGIPIVALEGLTPRDSWLQRGEDVLIQGSKVHGDEPFQVMSATTPILILNTKYADEISRLKTFSLSQYIKPDLFSHYPGFQGIRYAFEERNEKRLPKIIRSNLTRILDPSIHDLVEEAREAMDEIFGQSREWHSTRFKAGILRVVARLSNRIFLGAPLCHSERWLQITEGYATDAFLASQELRAMGFLTRPILYWFSKSCARLRNACKDAKVHLTDEFAQRRLQAQTSKSPNERLHGRGDSIAWIVEADPDISTADLVGAQLGLVVAAIQTTAEATSVALQHLCRYPQYIEPIRWEVESVLHKQGWTRMSLYKMQLLDSFLKESQRFNRGQQGITRMATEDVTLASGFQIRRGTRVMVQGTFWDECVMGPNVSEFDAYRFLQKHTYGDGHRSSKWQHTSVTADFMGFGLGEHACPGRFFASIEMKIVIALFSSRYDLRFETGTTDLKPVEKENVKFVELDSILQCRRRE